MGKHFSLTTTDKHSLGAYRADPAAQPKGGLVVVQEIFGVNHHIRAVCDRLAALGYVAVAPAVFDRFVRDFECGYTPDEIAHARSYLGNLNWDHMMADMAAGARAISRASARSASSASAWAAPRRFWRPPHSRLDGRGRLLRRHDRQVRRREAEMPGADAFRREGRRHPDGRGDEIKQKQPQAEIYIYPGAPHGFYCDERASYRKEAADLAWSRTQEFLGKHMRK